MEGGHKIEEGLWNSYPKQRHVHFCRIDVPLSWLGLDVNLEVVQPVLWGLAGGIVVLGVYQRRQTTILPKLLGRCSFINYLNLILDLSSRILSKCNKHV